VIIVLIETILHFRRAMSATSTLTTANPELRALATESAHRVTGVASFVLLADIGDERLPKGTPTLFWLFEGPLQARRIRLMHDGAVSRARLHPAGSVPEAAAPNSIAVENRRSPISTQFDMSDFGQLPEPRLPSLDRRFVAAL
jgi:hypothetical protein